MRLRDGTRPAFLIVNADDLGLSEGVNRAVFQAHREGILTSTSLMATGAAFAHAVAGLAATPDLGVGVHLCLNDELPALPAAEIPTLVGADGRLPPRGVMLGRLMSGRIAGRELLAELSAQIEKVAAAGIAVTHLDSHGHLHATPPVGRALLQAARAFHIPCVRRPEARSLVDFTTAAWGRIPLALGITCSSMLTRIVAGTPLRSPRCLLGLTRSGTMDEEWLCRVIRSLAPGTVTEIMLHPGDGSPLPAGRDHGPRERRRELDAALSPRVRETVRSRNVQLVSYRQLAAAAAA